VKRFLDWLIDVPRLERAFQWGRSAGLAGMALIILEAVFKAPAGLITGVFLLGFGAFCLLFADRFQEKGIWMLAVVFLALVAPVWVTFELMTIKEFFTPPSVPTKWYVALDAAVAVPVLGATVRLLAGVIALNRVAAKAGREP
jgi:hypothetical protein